MTKKTFIFLPKQKKRRKQPKHSLKDSIDENRLNLKKHFNHNQYT